MLNNFRYMFTTKMLLSKICNHKNYHCFANIVIEIEFLKTFGGKLLCGQQNTLALPQNVTHMVFGYRCAFDRPISFPNTLTHVTIVSPNDCLRVIPSLPSSVTHITMPRYSSRLDKIFPSTITHMKNDYYCCTSEYTLPHTITHLELW